MRIFISQPMRDKTNEEIKAERKRIEYILSKHYDDYEIVNNFFENAPHDTKPLWYLARSLELLSTADVAYFAKGWQDARGCKIEHDCAEAYEIYTITEM